MTILLLIIAYDCLIRVRQTASDRPRLTEPGFRETAVVSMYQPGNLRWTPAPTTEQCTRQTSSLSSVLQGRFYPDGLDRATHGEITDLVRPAGLSGERTRMKRKGQAPGMRRDHDPVFPQELASYLSKYKLLSSQRLRYHPRERGASGLA